MKNKKPVVLVIDDNEDSLLPNILGLRNNGYTTYGARLANNGHCYSDERKQICIFDLVERADIIFLDHYLTASTNGATLLEQLEQRDLIKGKRVIGISGDAALQSSYLTEHFPGLLSDWSHAA